MFNSSPDHNAGSTSDVPIIGGGPTEATITALLVKRGRNIRAVGETGAAVN